MSEIGRDTNRAQSHQRGRYHEGYGSRAKAGWRYLRQVAMAKYGPGTATGPQVG